MEDERKKHIEPTNGASMLEKSIRYSASTQNRIAYDEINGEFIIFERTDSGSYRGHVRGWEESDEMIGLDNDMKRVLIEMKIINADGTHI